MLAILSFRLVLSLSLLSTIIASWPLNATNAQLLVNRGTYGSSLSPLPPVAPASGKAQPKIHPLSLAHLAATPKDYRIRHAAWVEDIGSLVIHYRRAAGQESRDSNDEIDIISQHGMAQNFGLNGFPFMPDKTLEFTLHRPPFAAPERQLDQQVIQLHGGREEKTTRKPPKQHWFIPFSWHHMGQASVTIDEAISRAQAAIHEANQIIDHKNQVNAANARALKGTPKAEWAARIQLLQQVTVVNLRLPPNRAVPQLYYAFDCMQEKNSPSTMAHWMILIGTVKGLYKWEMPGTIMSIA